MVLTTVVQLQQVILTRFLKIYLWRKRSIFVALSQCHSASLHWVSLVERKKSRVEIENFNSYWNIINQVLLQESGKNACTWSTNEKIRKLWKHTFSSWEFSGSLFWEILIKWIHFLFCLFEGVLCFYKKRLIISYLKKKLYLI
jgi:hypothetical protein